MTFDVKEYWPQPKLGEKYTFDYFLKDGTLSVSSVYTMSDKVLYCNDFDKDQKWLDTWLIRFDDKRGVVEFGDDMPLTGWQKTLFGDKKKIRYKDGKEILWGNIHNLGDTISNSIEYDYFKSFGCLPPFAGPWSNGWQVVRFDKIHDTYTDNKGHKWTNVLEFTYRQIWGDKMYGAIYYCAKGIGPVEIRWIGDLSKVENRPDKSITTLITDPITAMVRVISNGKETIL
jgi:hypothetical protein